MILKTAPHRILFTNRIKHNQKLNIKAFVCFCHILFLPNCCMCTPPPLNPASTPLSKPFSLHLSISWVIIPVIQWRHHSAAESSMLFCRAPLSVRHAANSRPLEACCHFHSQISLLQRNGSHIIPHPTWCAELNTSLPVFTGWLISLHKDWWTPI